MLNTQNQTLVATACVHVNVIIPMCALFVGANNSILFVHIVRDNYDF
jgi:hypothetical protein